MTHHTNPLSMSHMEPPSSDDETNTEIGRLSTRMKLLGDSWVELHPTISSSSDVYFFVATLHGSFL